MNTLKQFSRGVESVPTGVSWYLADLGEALGRQALYAHQAPQRLKSLREHALIESAVSSNRIEGVEINQTRVGTVLFGQSLLRDRNEEELRGYREALEWIHTGWDGQSVSGQTIKTLHHYTRGGMGDAGCYKERPGDIIEKYPDGRERIRFRTVEPGLVADYVDQLASLWPDCLRERWVPPLIGLAAFNLDFLCIHPFRDGNGRVSRLLLLMQSYQLGYEVGRYISLERLIEQNKERYYETLEGSSAGWHEGRHNPWPYVNFVLFILASAYKEFEERVGRIGMERGEKTSLVLRVIGEKNTDFSVSELQTACSGVSSDLIRAVLKRLKKEGRIECLGRGQKAVWRKTERWESGNTQ